MGTSIRLKPDVLKIHAITAHMRMLLKDKRFKQNFQKDPVGMIEQFGLSRRQAVNIIANDLGVKAASDWCVCTGCCCTGCSYTGKSNFNFRSLPALNDATGWKKLALGR